MGSADEQGHAGAGVETLGLIAGGGQFPLLAAEAARRKGLRVFAVAHLDETDPALADKVDAIAWIKLGQFGRLLKAFKAQGVHRALMAGSISKHRMFAKVQPDARGLALMTKLAVFHDDHILRAVDREFAREGIEIVSSVAYLEELVAPEGVLTRRRPTRAETGDIEFGWRIAKELGRLDIGQCVVVRRKTVLAVETIEGTDATILRGGALGREQAVVVKVCKPNQDLRFDLPTVGLGTIRVMEQVKASALAVEAGRTLMMDRPALVAAAERAGITVVSRRFTPEV